jgi:hypothetical protein
MLYNAASAAVSISKKRSATTKTRILFMYVIAMMPFILVAINCPLMDRANKYPD